MIILPCRDKKLVKWSFCKAHLDILAGSQNKSLARLIFINQSLHTTLKTLGIDTHWLIWQETSWIATKKNKFCT
jgi:hypothetical protein